CNRPTPPTYHRRVPRTRIFLRSRRRDELRNAFFIPVPATTTTRHTSMKNEANAHFRHYFPKPAARALAVCLLCVGGAAACNDSATDATQEMIDGAEAGLSLADRGGSSTELRRFIAGQVGGIAKLMVPADNAALRQPRLADGSPDPQFETTEAKRYLGKLLFHEPARATRIIPEFGGIPAHSGTASCGTCHLGEAASKAGTLLNF